jgi:hypothetical protein
MKFKLATVEDIVDITDFGYEEEDWEEMSHLEKLDVVQEWINREMDFGYKE